MRASVIYFAGVSFVMLFGCASEEPKAETPVGGSVAQGPIGKMPDDEIHSGLTQPTTSVEAPKPKLSDLKKVRAAAKAAFEKSPKDEKSKKAYVEATVKLGTATMNAAELPPREKYRGALALYREALKLDPKNEEALENKKLIEDIYKSMGRPIPQ
jgi:hypothetical protein